MSAVKPLAVANSLYLAAWLVAALTAGAAFRASATAPLEKLPLSFEANQGQAAPEAQFVSHSRSGTLLLGPTKATVLLPTADTPPRSRGQTAERLRNRKVHCRAISLEFVAANPAAAMSGANLLPGKANYFIGSDPACWRTDLPLFERVRVAGLYRGVDVIYYGNQRRLEYDLIVAPGADLGRVRLRVCGADRLELDAQGDLVLSVGEMRLRQHKPVLHQVVAGAVTPVTGRFRMVNPDTVAFEVGPHDAQLPLIIDPILTYSSYFGGTGTDVAWDTGVDAAGNVYVAGETLSAGLPATQGAFDTQYSGGYPGAGGDAFVAKFDPTGSTLLYMTYVGGTGDDAALGIAVDAAGNAYLTGATDSTDFPLQSAIRSVLTGTPSPRLGLRPFDAFVTKLNPSGSGLAYSTYLGGDNQDEGIGIAVDAANSAYVTGFTESSNFLIASALQTNLAGFRNVFVSKFSPAGTALAYSTYLGGTNDDEGDGIAVDAAGRAFVTGLATSTNFPQANAIQPWLGGGQDAFVTVIAANGQSLLTSTYLGGAVNEIGYRIAVDSAGSAYVVGTEASGYDIDGAFPITPGNLNPGGMFVTSDAGASWRAADTGLRHPHVHALAVDPASPARVYAGTGRGIARSIDGGATWVGTTNVPPTTTGLAPEVALGSVYSLAIDPRTNSTIYAGTSGGLYRSLDAGASWSLSNTGFAAFAVGVYVSSIAVDPVTPTTLYAATADFTGTAGPGVYRSTNAAATWTAVNSGLHTYNVWSLAIDPQAPSRLYAGTGLGVYRSDNRGALWVPFTNGFTSVTVLTVAIDPQTPSTLYAGSTGGLFKSTNRGTNWTLLSLGATVTNGLEVFAVAIDPATTTTIYAGTLYGVFKSYDGGLSWDALTNGFPAETVGSLAVDPANPDRVYLGATPASGVASTAAFLTKLTDTARALQFSTVQGGAADVTAWAVAVDAAGNSYIVGNTTATNYPTVDAAGALSATNHGGNDVFVTAFNNDASAFLYSVYLGGSSDEFAYGIALDRLGGAWVVGQTSSTDFPTNSAFQPNLSGGGGIDAFLARISPTPTLTATRVADSLQLTWREPDSLFTLQRASSLPVPSGGWTNVLQAPVISNGWHTVTLPADGAGFFRLSSP